MRKFRSFQASIAVLALLGNSAFAQGVLGNCADQFINGDADNAPTIFSSPPGEPFGSNKHLCYRDDDVSFFAAEYWPEEFAPRWAAYKISPENYGTNGCATYTRAIANCYVRGDSWTDFQNCTSGSDPFHTDHMLTGTLLGRSDFSNTGHDRGHIAPRQAFSWHVCGTYQTFSMANMSPQRAFLNQDIWQFLERQVLTWGVDDGPVFVVTGTTFRTFPHQSFAVYTDDILDPAQIYAHRKTMRSAVEEHHDNFLNNSSGEILRPDRDSNPDRIKAKVEEMRMPTGYFKVIYRPSIGSEPAHTIAFLLPHTFENLNVIAENYSNLETNESFWVFVSRIDLIEEASGVRFPGIPESMKSVWGDDWFFARDTSRNIRASSCGKGTPQGILKNSTKEERLAACTDQLN